MKKIITIALILFAFTASFAQDGGMRVYVGSTSLVNKDVIANPKGSSHSGYHIGMDGRLMSGGMAFLVGGRYTSVSNMATEDFKLLGHNSSVSIMNGRVGLDISIYSFTNKIRIRTKALASFDIVLNDPGNSIPTHVLNDGWAGVVTGLGFDLGPAVLDIEYELGVINAYNKIKSSTFNSLSFSLGFFF